MKQKIGIGENEKIRGRWDIDFVKNPKYQPSGSYIDKFLVAYLMTVYLNNQGAWKCLKDTLKLVEELGARPPDVPQETKGAV